jgi:hypothetical protein
MLTVLTLYLLGVLLSSAMVLLGVASLARGYKRRGWHGRRSLSNWMSVAGIFLGMFVLATKARELPPGNLVFGILLGIGLALLLRPAIAREEERTDSGTGPG